MKLHEIIDDNEIKIDLEAEDKYEAIEELVDLLIAEHEISLRDRDEIIEVVMQREKSISTGVGGGVAIPHGTISCTEEIVGAIGISHRGIDFESVDGALVYIVLLLLVPKTQIGKHIKTLAQIARTLNHQAVRDRIRAADSPEEVFDILEAAGREE